MTALVVERGDPEQARHLLEASHALMTSLFPVEANHFLSLEALKQPDIRFFVAHEGDAVPGCAALAVRDGYGELKSMFVDEAARGRGVARALLVRLEEEARRLELPVVRLETGNLLTDARRLYGRHGFSECGPFGEYAHGPFSVFMEKRIA